MKYLPFKDIWAKIVHWPYWMEVVRLATFIMVGFLIAFAITAYSHEQVSQNKVLEQVKQNTTTIKRQVAIIKSQANTIKQLTQEVKDDTDSIHQQATCIFLFFSQPQVTRDSTSVTYPPACVTASSFGGATGSNKSTVTNAPTTTTNNNAGGTTSPPTKSKPNSQPQPSKKEKAKNLVCKLTISLLCL